MCTAVPTTLWLTIMHLPMPTNCNGCDLSAVADGVVAGVGGRHAAASAVDDITRHIHKDSPKFVCSIWLPIVFGSLLRSGTRHKATSPLEQLYSAKLSRIIFSQPPRFSHTRFSIRLSFSISRGSFAVESIQPAAFVNRCTTIQPQGMGAKSAVPKKLSKADVGAAQMEWKTFVT